MRFPLTTLLPAACLACLVWSACGPVVQYTDELRNSDGSRTIFVTGVGQVGGTVGFLAGVPLDVVALPVTVPVHLIQKSNQPEQADLLTTILFPSLVTLSIGTLIAAPLDLVEYSVYRAWLPENTMTAEELRHFEFELGRETLPRYPVIPLYPLPEDAGNLGT